MTDWTDETLRQLDQLASIAFPKDSGVTGTTLQRLARQGKLVVYKPGGKYLSTLANLRRALDETIPAPSKTERPPGMANALAPNAAGSAIARLEHVRQKLREQEQEKRLAERAQRARDRLIRKSEQAAERRAARKAARAAERRNDRP